MARLIDYSKSLFIALITKGKILWNKAWFSKDSKAIQEEVELHTFASKYDSIFPVEQTNEDIFVPKGTWDQIKLSVPDKFVIPNPHTAILLEAMKADFYNRLFKYPSSNPSMLVDSNVWSKLVNNLPENYLLPIPLFDKIVEPIKNDNKETDYSEFFGPKDVSFDHAIWERIVKNLPDHYTLPNPTLQFVNNPQVNSTMQLLSKH